MPSSGPTHYIAKPGLPLARFMMVNFAGQPNTTAATFAAASSSSAGIAWRRMWGRGLATEKTVAILWPCCL